MQVQPSPWISNARYVICRDHRAVFEKYRTEIQSLLNHHVNELNSAEDKTPNSKSQEAENVGLTDSESQEPESDDLADFESQEPENDYLTDFESQEAENDDISTSGKAAVLWKAMQDHIPRLWERIKFESVITFDINQKDARVAYIQRQRGSKKASKVTIEDKIRTGLSELALAEGYDEHEQREGYPSTANRWAHRLRDEEEFTPKSFLEGGRVGCNIKRYVKSFDFTEGSPGEKTAVTGTRYGRKSLVCKRLLEHANDGKVDAFGLQCLTSLAHQEWKSISLPELKSLLEILMDPSSVIKLLDSDGNIEIMHVSDVISRVSFGTGDYIKTFNVLFSHSLA